MLIKHLLRYVQILQTTFQPLLLTDPIRNLPFLHFPQDMYHLLPTVLACLDRITHKSLQVLASQLSSQDISHSPVYAY